MRCRLRQVPFQQRCGPLVRNPPAGLMSTRFGQTLIDTKGARLGNAPGMHLLTAHTIPELRFTLEHQDLIVALRKALRQCRSCKTAADGYDVIRSRHGLGGDLHFDTGTPPIKCCALPHPRANCSP